MDFPFDSSDKELEAHALKMWANWIETGNVLTSANDIEESCLQPTIVARQSGKTNHVLCS
jgi:hypothetical protein